MIAYAPFGGSRLHALYETWISNDYVWGQPSNTGSWTLVADGVIGATNAHQYIDFLIPNNARFIKIIHTGDIGLNGDIWDYFHSIGYLESLPTI